MAFDTLQKIYLKKDQSKQDLFVSELKVSAKVIKSKVYDIYIIIP